MSSDKGIQKWIDSAGAWITDQGSDGDWSRRAILDPALEPIIAEINGKEVLDLGCGEGRYARVLKGKGALVTGVDPVPEFIQRARSLDAESTYEVGTAESIPFVDASFDVLLCYLSIIDIADLTAASKEITRVLRDGGQLIVVTISNLASTTSSWVKDGEGKKIYRTVDRYMEQFALDLEWRGIRISNYHRPLSYTLGLFLDEGYVLTKFIEPLPDRSDPNFEDERRVPTFQIFTFDHVA
ncbi:MAG: class I SAM-dependent methyltransferase [Planctomycetota bacterium]